MQTVRYQFIRVQPTAHELVIIVLQIADTCVHEQLIAVLHLDNERVEGVDHTVTLGDDDLLGIGVRHRCQEMFDKRFIGSELHHLRVHHHEFQLRRMFLIEQGGDDCIDSNGLTGTCCTRYEQVGRLGEVEHKDLIRDRSSVRDGQFHLLLVLETFGSDHRVHGNDLRFLVRHLDTDGTLTGHRSDDTYSCRTQTHHDIVLERLDLRYADTRFRNDLIERDGRTYGRFDGLDLYAVISQSGHYSCAVSPLFLFVDHRRRLIVIDLQQVQRGELVELQVLTRIVGSEFLQELVGIFGVQLILVHLLNLQCRIVLRPLYLVTWYIFRFFHRERSIA